MHRAVVQRHEDILAELFHKKHVSVKTLAVQMSVSEATVRRDLRILADQRELTLVHGGATMPRQGDFSFQAKTLRSPEAKQVIGHLAAELVGDGDQIFIDSGTTCFQMIPGLRCRENVLVIATSLRLAGEMIIPGLNIILLGGQYRATRMDTIGPVALNALEQLRGYVAFIGADGLSQDFGPTAIDIDSAHLHQCVVKNARQTVLLADQNKFDVPSLFRIAPWEEIDLIVTESEPNETWRDFFGERGIDVIYPIGERPDAEKSNH